MVERNVVLAAFNTRQQVGGIGDNEIGAHIHLAGQQLAEFDFEAGQLAVFLEVERWRIGFKCNAQFAAVIDFIDQFGVSQRAQKG
ncbi:hypothetical protein D3C86_1829140 [compost metagenome]